MLSALKKAVSTRKSLGSPSRLSKVGEEAARVQAAAPHPVPAGREHALCPITGLGLGDEHASKWAMKAAMDLDADILEERQSLNGLSGKVPATLPPRQASANL